MNKKNKEILKDSSIFVGMYLLSFIILSLSKVQNTFFNLIEKTVESPNLSIIDFLVGGTVSVFIFLFAGLISIILFYLYKKIKK